MVKHTNVLAGIPRYLSKRFTWHKGVGATEASSLGLPVGAEPGQRVYADACDVGFIIQGDREDKLFILESTSPNNDWTFVSECGKYRCTVFND